MNTQRKQFENCDQFADYIFDSVLELGDKVTLEFNKATNLDIPTGWSLSEWLEKNPQRGENFKEFGTVRSFLYDIYELAKSPLFQYYERVRQAYYWSSMNPNRAARTNLNEHIAQLNDDLQEIPESDQEWYTEKYIKMYLDWVSSKSRTASSMVTGPANFNTRRNEKALNAEHNKYSAFSEWRDKAMSGIKKRIEKNRPESEKLNNAWVELKNDIIRQATVIIGIDNGTEPYSRPLFVSSMVGKIERLAKNGNLELVERALNLIEEINKSQKKPIISQRNSVWKLREKAFDAQTKKENPEESKTIAIEGGEIIINHADDRIQVRHEEKPSKEIIDQLKKNAFKWSPFNKCWQRKLTSNAIYATNKMFSTTI